MSLAILVPLVVIGVALVVLTVAYSGLSHEARIDDIDRLRARFQIEYPEVSLGDAVVTDDRRAAFFRCRDGAVALASAFGDRLVTRLLSGGDTRTLERTGDTEARLALNDFTFAPIRVRFASRDDLDRVSGWLEEDHA